MLRMPEESLPWRPPKWTQPFSSSRVQQGCEAVFEGVVYGCPAPTISWVWRGKPLEDWTGKDRLGKVTKYDEKSGKVTLVIENLGPGDEGQYMCRADNPYGDSTCTIAVRAALLLTVYLRVVIIADHPRGYQEVHSSSQTLLQTKAESLSHRF